MVLRFPQAVQQETPDIPQKYRKEGFYTWYFFSLSRTLTYSKGSQAREMVFSVLEAYVYY